MGPAPVAACGCRDLPPECHAAITVVDCARQEVPAAKLTNIQLLAAARDGDAAALDKALRAGAGLETRLPLKVKACYADKSGMRPQKRNRDRHGLTPLMYAAQGGYLTCVMTLLEANAAVNAQDEDALTPLHFAAMGGDLDVCKALLCHGADREARDSDGVKPVRYLPDDVRRDPRQLRRWQEILSGETITV